MSKPLADAVFVVTETCREGAMVGIFCRASDALEKVLDRMEQEFPKHKFSHRVDAHYDETGLQTLVCLYAYRSSGKSDVGYTISEVLLDKWMGS